MFDSNNKREASITLCLFPHLGEFIAIDARNELPEGAAVHVLGFDTVFTDEFRSALEIGFSSLVRKDGAGLMDMIGMPQEVEVMVRAESMKRIVKNLNHAAGVPHAGLDGGIGVLFFARGLLSIENDQLETAMDELFGNQLTGAQLDRLIRELHRLIASERDAEDKIRHREMSQLIKGDTGQFLTLWQSDASK